MGTAVICVCAFHSVSLKFVGEMKRREQDGNCSEGTDRWWISVRVRKFSFPIEDVAFTA